jgi:hypothetical protein
MTPETLRRILDPEPGTDLARAKEYGIDLTILARNVAESDEERGRRAIRTFAAARAIQRARLSPQS